MLNTFKLDLHVHSRLSDDGRSSKEELAKAAAARGLDALVLTDHNACALESSELHGGVWLFPGCEISTDAGHILGLFLDKAPDIAALRKNGLASAAETVAMLRECGGVTVQAHPFERKDARTDVPVDCIETVNSRVYIQNPEANAQAAKLAISRNLPATGGSDAHSAGEVGNAYTVFEVPDCSMPALREALLSGLCKPILIQNTPRRLKGYSQFRYAWFTRNPYRIIKGIAYIFYSILLDIVKGTK